MPGRIIETWDVEALRAANQLWQDAAKTTNATADGHRVDRMVGTTHELQSDDADRRPTLRTSGFNGRASLEFNTIDIQRLWKDPLAFTSAADGYCVYLVAKYDVLADNDYLFGITDGLFNANTNYSVGLRIVSGFFEGWVGTARGDPGHDQVGRCLAQDTNEHLFVMYWRRQRGAILLIDGQHTYARESGTWVRAAPFPPRATAGMQADRFHIGGGPVGNDADCTIAYVRLVEMVDEDDEWDVINNHSDVLLTQFGLTRAVAML